MSVYYKVYGSTADRGANGFNATYATARSSTSASASNTFVSNDVGQQLSGGNYSVHQLFYQFDLSALPSVGTTYLNPSFSTNATTGTDTIEIRQVSSLLNKIAGDSLAALTQLGSFPARGPVNVYSTTAPTKFKLTLGSPTQSAASILLLHSQNERLNVAPTTATERIILRMADATGTTQDPFLEVAAPSTQVFLATQATTIQSYTVPSDWGEASGLATIDVLGPGGSGFAGTTGTGGNGGGGGAGGMYAKRTAPGLTAGSTVYYQLGAGLDTWFNDQNLLTQTDNLLAGWAKNDLTVTNNATDPLGGSTAGLLTETTGVTQHCIFKPVVRTEPAATARSYRFSATVKSSTRNVGFVAWQNGSAINSGVGFDLQGTDGGVGTVISAWTDNAARGTFTSPVITPLGSGWWRISANFNILAGGNDTDFEWQITLHNPGSGVALDYPGSTSANVTVYGCTCTYGTVDKGFVPTTTEAAYSVYAKAGPSATSITGATAPTTGGQGEIVNAGGSGGNSGATRGGGGGGGAGGPAGLGQAGGTSNSATAGGGGGGGSNGILSWPGNSPTTGTGGNGGHGVLGTGGGTGGATNLGGAATNDTGGGGGGGFRSAVAAANSTGGAAADTIYWDATHGVGGGGGGGGGNSVNTNGPTTSGGVGGGYGGGGGGAGYARAATSTRAGGLGKQGIVVLNYVAAAAGPISGTLTSTLDAMTVAGTGKVLVQGQLVMGTSPTAPTSNLLTFYTPSTSDRDDFTGEVGLWFTVTANTTINWLGSLVAAGNSGIHTLYLYERDTLTVLRTASVDMTGKTTGTYAWASISPITLTTGTTYALVKPTVQSSGQGWSDSKPTTFPAFSTYANTYRQPPGGFTGNVPNEQFVGLDLGSGPTTSGFDALTLAGTGTVADFVASNNGSLTATLDALTATGTGKVPSQGILTTTLGALTATGTGKVEVKGTLASTLGTLTAAGTGKVTVKGTSTVTLDPATLTGTGKIAVKGTSSVTLGAMTAAATGKVIIQGYLDMTTGGVGGGVVTPNIFFRSVSSVNYASRTNTTVDAPAGTVDGDILIASIVTGAGSAVPSATPPTGFVLIGSETQADTAVFHVKMATYWKRASSEPSTYTFGHSTCSSQANIRAYAGCLTAGVPVGPTSYATGIGTGVSVPGITTTADYSFLLYDAHDWQGSGVLNPPTGMTERYDNLLYAADQFITSPSATGARTQVNVNASTEPWQARLTELLNSIGVYQGSVAFRSKTSTNYVGTGSTVLAAPAGLADGDILIASIFVGSAVTTTTVPTPPAGFAAFGTPTSVNQSGFYGTLHIFWKRATSESGSYTFTHGPNESAQGALKAYSGCIASGNPFGATSNNTGVDNIAVGSSITTTAANSYLLFIAHDWEGTGGLSPPPGMVERQDSLVYTADQALSASGIGTATRTMTNANLSGGRWAVRMVELLTAPVAAGTGGFDDLTLSGTGTVGAAAANTGTLAATLDAMTATGTGTVANQIFSGTLAVTLGAATLAGTGVVPSRGSLTTTLGALTVTGAGTVANQVFSGTLTQTLGALTVVGTGTLRIGGTANVTLAPAALAGTGTVVNQIFSGSLTATLAPLTALGTGTLQIKGTLAATLGDLTLAGFSGAVPTLGTLTVTLAPLTLTSTGVVPIKGTLATTLGALTATATGKVTVQGTTTVTLGALTVLGTGKVRLVGTLGTTLDALTALATGSVPAKGTLATTLAPLTALGTGNVIVRGTLSATLGPMLLAATGRATSSTAPPRSVDLIGILDLRTSLIGIVPDLHDVLGATMSRRVAIGATMSRRVTLTATRPPSRETMTGRRMTRLLLEDA